MSAALRRAPSLLTYHPETLCAKRDSLATLFGLAPSSPRVAALLRRQPLVLALDVGGLGQRLEQLQDCLGLGRDGLVRLVFSQPGLLTLAAASVERKARALHASLGVSPAQAAAMVLANPSLLTLNSETVLRKREALMRHLEACPAGWREQLLGGSPHTLGVLLCMSEPRLARLRFLGEKYGSGHASNRSSSAARGSSGIGFGSCESGSSSSSSAIISDGSRSPRATGALEDVPWRRLLMLTDAALEKRCPGWLAWQQEHLSRGFEQLPRGGHGPIGTGGQRARATGADYGHHVACAAAV